MVSWLTVLPFHCFNHPLEFNWNVIFIIIVIRPIRSVAMQSAAGGYSSVLYDVALCTTDIVNNDAQLFF